MQFAVDFLYFLRSSLNSRFSEVSTFSYHKGYNCVQKSLAGAPKSTIFASLHKNEKKNPDSYEVKMNWLYLINF